MSLSFFLFPLRGAEKMPPPPPHPTPPLRPFHCPNSRENSICWQAAALTCCGSTCNLHLTTASCIRAPGVLLLALLVLLLFPTLCPACDFVFTTCICHSC